MSTQRPRLTQAVQGVDYTPPSPVSLWARAAALNIRSFSAEIRVRRLPISPMIPALTSVPSIPSINSLTMSSASRLVLVW